MLGLVWLYWWFVLEAGRVRNEADPLLGFVSLYWEAVMVGVVRVN